MPIPSPGTGSNYITPAGTIPAFLPPLTRTYIPSQYRTTIRLSLTQPRPKSSRIYTLHPSSYTPRFEMHEMTHPLPSFLFPIPPPAPSDTTHPIPSLNHHPPIPTPAHSLILINLITHNHHPEIKRRPHQQERPPGLPALTDIILHQPRQRLDALSPALLPADIHGAVAVDVALRTPELDAYDD